MGRCRRPKPWTPRSSSCRGLHAASAIGILHRDVKPSNCFGGTHGVVKIGDFGISRSLRPTEETHVLDPDPVAATPTYASPEQLRGAALDTRADIYSLGATLYELLTGRPPFERQDCMALLMAVANDAPQPPHAFVPAVPKGLSHVVLRCLAKRPDQRFADYDALAAALAPHSSTAAKPATLGVRFFAGVVDQCLLGLLVALASFWWLGVFIPLERGGMLRQQLTWAFILLAYFGIAETVWFATPGKALVGLTLADSSGRPPRARRAWSHARPSSLRSGPPAESFGWPCGQIRATSTSSYLRRGLSSSCRCSPGYCRPRCSRQLGAATAMPRCTISSRARSSSSGGSWREL